MRRARSSSSSSSSSSYWSRSGLRVATLAAAGVVPLTLVAPPAHADEHRAKVLVRQIAREVVTPRPGAEADTLVEPDLAVSPRDPRVAVAVAHEGRFPDGGATSISHAWTRDGGRSWHFGTVPGLTRATGGTWDRVSDPVLAFDRHGAVYLSTLVFDENDCRTAVLVQRSTDGGATFGTPVAADLQTECFPSDDKNWIAVDTNEHSRFRDRVYQFWSAFTTDENAEQRVRWSDDRGRTWSPAVIVTPGATASTQDSQVLIHPDGSITDVYQDFEGTPARPDRDTREGADAALARPSAPAAPAAAAAAVPQVPLLPLRARTSHDGGATWSAPVLVTDDGFGGSSNVRCCLPAGTVDTRTGRLYLSWVGGQRPGVWLASSTDGVHWGRFRQTDTARRASDEYVNVDVAARAGTVMVAFGRQPLAADGGHGTVVRQNLAFSGDAGRSFRRPLVVGPPSDLRFAAQVGDPANPTTPFPGDYTGTAAGRDGRFWSVWATSSRPPAGARFHQVLEAAVVGWARS